MLEKDANYTLPSVRASESLHLSRQIREAEIRKRSVAIRLLEKKMVVTE